MTGLAAYAQMATLDPEELVTTHAPLVKRIAYHLLARLPPNVLADDLIQAGMIGLLEAARHYDPAQGASFDTYAGIRIRGAMLDEIRRCDWAPRSLHRKVREVSEAIRSIERRESRDARDAEVAAELGIGLREYHQILQQASGQRLFSIEDLAAGAETISESLGDGISGPLEELQGEEFREVLARAVASLPEREQLVMSLYYEEELNLREIGEVLGVSESRVCQIHGQALVRIKARMREWQAA